MENFTKLIQAEWENIWDFVFGRDGLDDKLTTPAEQASANTEPTTDQAPQVDLLQPDRT